MKLKKNICDFITFLHKACTKDAGEKAQLTYEPLKLAIVLVGRSEIVRQCYYGYEPYLHYIQGAIKEGINTFYVLAKGALNTTIADIVSRLLEEQKLVKVTDRYIDEVEDNRKLASVACIRLECLHTPAE